MVCSNCAAGLPSAVTAVQLSGHVMESMLPIVRIGSAVEVELVGYHSFDQHRAINLYNIMACTSNEER